MKKTVQIILMTLLCLCVVSCGANAEISLDISFNEGIIQSSNLCAVTSLYEACLPEGTIKKIGYRDKMVDITLLNEKNQATLYRVHIDTGAKEVRFVGDGATSDFCMGNDGNTVWRLRQEIIWIDQENYQADNQYYLELLDHNGDVKLAVRLEMNLFPRKWLVDENGDIWCVAVSFGEEQDSRLYHVSKTGAILLDIDVAEAEIDFSSIEDMCLAGDGTLLVLTEECLSFWTEDGMASKCDAGSGALIETPSGLYWAATGAEDSLFPIDLEEHSIGASVSGLYGAIYVYPGDGIYDCILVTAEKVLGLHIGEGARELFASPAGNYTLMDFVCALDENTFLMSTYNGMLNSYVLNQVSLLEESSVPKKTTLVLAMVEGTTQFHCFDEWIAYYNQNTADYQIQVVEYEDEGALALALSTGEQIDILAYGAESGFYKGCWQHGYLKNMYEIIDADAAISDLVSAYRLCIEESDGGFYRISSSFWLSMLVGRTQYVETPGKLSAVALGELAESLPENMNLMDGGWEQALRSFLVLNQFVDYEQGCCNFNCQEFYDLLALIRDQFTEYGRSYTDVGEYISEQAAVQSVAIQGIYDFWLKPLAEDEFTPLTITNLGAKVILEDSYSIASASEHPEAAWDFIRILLSPGVQKNSVFLPVSQLELDNQIQDALVNENITAMVAEQIETLLEGALYLGYTDETIFSIVYEESQACFSGEKSIEEVAQVIQSRCSIYLSEQS